MGGLALRCWDCKMARKSNARRKGNEVLLKNFSQGLAAESKTCPLELALQVDAHLKE